MGLKENILQVKAGVAILISNKTKCKQKNVSRAGEGYFIMINHLIC